ncbi:MAG: hypothetical protein ACRD09_11550 [Vicinamibacterales bacterium]
MRWRLFRGSAARRAREAELSTFRAELDAAAERHDAATGAWPALQDGLLGRLALRADALGLTDDDGALELEMINGLRELAALVLAVERDGLPLLETQHRVITGESCRFSAPATRVFDANDSNGAEGASGRLFLTDRRVVFLGPSVTGVPWPSIAGIARTGRDVVLSGASRRYRFRLNTFADALRATWLAERLR